MKKIREFMNSIDDGLGAILFDSIKDFVNGRRDVQKILEEELDEAECENILSNFIIKIGLDLGEFGFEEDSNQKFGFSWESVDEDNTFAFESVWHDVTEVIVGVIDDVEIEGSLDESQRDSIYLQGRWDDDPY